MQAIARSRSPSPGLMQKNLTTPAPTLTAREATYGLRLGQLCIPWLPAVLIMVGAGLVSASHIAGDSWLSLVGGREIVQHGLPSQDTLSSLGHGRAWTDEEWLSQLVFYAAYTVGGLGAVMVVGRIAVTIGELVALGVAGARRSSSLSVGLALLMAFALLGSRSEVRAQLLAEPLFALVLWLLVDEVRRPTRRALWAAPLILLVWANLHGSVLLGSALVLLAMAFVAAQRSRRRSASDLRRIGWLVLVALLAPFATPYGWRIVDYYRSTLDNHTLARFLTEWSHSTPSTAPLECGAVAVVVVLVALNWRRARLFEAAVLLTLAGATLLAQRNAVWLALAIAALLPPLLDRIVPARLQLREIRGAALLFALAAAFGVVMLARMAGTDDAALATGLPSERECDQRRRCARSARGRARHTRARRLAAVPGSGARRAHRRRRSLRGDLEPGLRSAGRCPRRPPLARSDLPSRPDPRAEPRHGPCTASDPGSRRANGGRRRRARPHNTSRATTLRDRTLTLRAAPRSPRPRRTRRSTRPR